ncbi:FAD-dependent monooxygenase [Amycolatopsis acidicola]|uniref:FAD-dependent monooxygenase n=1 Tax=Amycolatopsis acidicola TaxID=2596893 RepID=UPI001408D4B0|nr:FAD-dependent monooxygenase [Amycolatopsis acidicola]
MAEERVPVLIAGGGPVGLALALELEHHGVEALLIERSLETTRHPKMDVTNGRSMELFRRMGVAGDLRKVAVPADHPLVVTWVTRQTGWELARFAYPSVDDRYEEIRSRNDGAQPLEPNMRVSQVVLEPALKELLQSRGRHVRVRYGWALESFTQDDSGVDAVITSTRTGETRRVRAAYLAGCDGAGSRTRQGLGIGLDRVPLLRLLVKELGPLRAAGMAVRRLAGLGERPMDGRFFLVHFTSPEREFFERFGTAWHIQSPEGWTLISQNDRDTWTMHAPLGMSVDAEKIDPERFLFERLGRPVACDILQANAWTPQLNVAKRFGHGRVWLAGDAVHQVTPTGGYGMNTGVGDAVGLGWALAAQVQGWGEPGLLRAYEAERRPVAVRNRDAAARHTVVRGAIMAAFRAAIHSENWRGERSRRRLGREIRDLGNLENEALGIEFGYRYDKSPAVWPDPGTPPIQTSDAYTPSTWPGSRPPSLFLADGRAIFDLFGPGFTLLRFTGTDVASLTGAAAERNVPIEVVDIRDDHARRLYERDLVLIRPDQHVAWRGDTLPDSPLRLIDRVRGVAT